MHHNSLTTRRPSNVDADALKLIIHAHHAKNTRTKIEILTVVDRFSKTLGMFSALNVPALFPALVSYPIIAEILHSGKQVED